MMSLGLSKHCILDGDEVVFGEAAVCCWRTSVVQHVPAWSSEYMYCL